MKKIVIIPGGFHPFHAGHKALYDAAVAAFPSADVYVAATADTSTRPFPFEIKQKLARLAGIPAHRFIQVKSPFQAREITQMFDPETTQLIFVRSEKDRDQPPQAGGVKKNGEPAYLQPYRRNGLLPMSQHGYMAYLPVVTFGPGMASATEIRAKWPDMTTEQKVSLLHSMYPALVANERLTQVVQDMLDTVMMPGAQSPVAEATFANEPEGHVIYPDGMMGGYSPDALERAVLAHMQDIMSAVKAKDYDKAYYGIYRWEVLKNKLSALDKYKKYMTSQGQRRIRPGRMVDLGEDYLDEGEWSQKYKRSIDCDNPKGFSQRAHCAGRKARQSGRKTKSQSTN